MYSNHVRIFPLIQSIVASRENPAEFQIQVQHDSDAVVGVIVDSENKRKRVDFIKRTTDNVWYFTVGDLPKGKYEVQFFLVSRTKREGNVTRYKGTILVEYYVEMV